MILEVLGSSSKGNCYLLKAKGGETILLEAGVNIREIKKALKFNFRQVAGCLITHEHKDHSKSVMDLNMMGIPIYSTKGTRDALNLPSKRENEFIQDITVLHIGKFSVTAYTAHHDAAEPCMYLIYHPEMGNLLFATDTYLINYNFRGLDHYLIEANYSVEILQKKVEAGQLNLRLAQRIMKSHLSLERAIQQIKGSPELKNVILVHLSDNNSNAKEFKEEVQRATGVPVYIADKGLEIELKGDKE